MSEHYKSLRQAIKNASDRDAYRCDELILNGLGEERRWGFRVYRTVYQPGSDEQFAAAMRFLEAYMRDDCVGEHGLDGALQDGTAHEALLQRLKLDIVEDRDLESASPAVIQQHFQAWVESQGFHLCTALSPDPSTEMLSSSWHRFCIITDAEALQNVLRFPVPVVRRPRDREDHLGVKVLDVECNDDSDEYEPPFHEGWLWAAPWEVAGLWFECHYMAPEEMRTTDAAGRPVLFILP